MRLGLPKLQASKHKKQHKTSKASPDRRVRVTSLFKTKIPARIRERRHHHADQLPPCPPPSPSWNGLRPDHLSPLNATTTTTNAAGKEDQPPDAAGRRDATTTAAAAATTCPLFRPPLPIPRPPPPPPLDARRNLAAPAKGSPPLPSPRRGGGGGETKAKEEGERGAMWAKAEAPTPSQQRAARRPAYIRGPPPAPGDRHRGARDRVGGGRTRAHPTHGR
ncbi:hypothetical protein DAI22_02g186500 [Oryza sativa Japonica Group]|nr:hypothetical protein DAI22_02g186500 [Oryza sativa Japonica Group]